MCVYVCVCVCWSTDSRGDPKGPFSIATTLRCRREHYSFPLIALLSLDQYLKMQSGIKYHFYSLWYDSTWDWTPVFRNIGEHSNQYCKFKNYYW